VSSKPKKDAKDFRMKLLLLGSPQTGKSTFLKQLQLNFVHGFGEKERTDVQRTLSHNLVMGLRDIIDYMADHNVEVPAKITEEVKFFKSEVDLGNVKKFTSDLSKNAKALWADPEVQKVWAARDSIPTFLIFNLDYIMDNLERLTQEEVVPSDEDILRSRQRTTNNYKLEFEYEKRAFEITDVGGQKYARKQWASAVPDPGAVIYFAALSDYDVPVFNQPKLKLEESLEIFAEVVMIPEFAEVNFILMLNKFDVFEKKLKEKPIQKIREYRKVEGTDAAEIAKRIVHRFQRRMPDARRNTVLSNVICAIDTQQMKKVFLALKDLITSRALDDVFS